MVLSGQTSARDLELLCRSWDDMICMITIVPALSATILVLLFVLWAASCSNTNPVLSTSAKSASTWGQLAISWLKAVFISPFKPFLTVHEALEILHGERYSHYSHDEGVSARPRINLQMGFMVASAVLEILTHIALFLYRMINVSPKDAAVWMFYTPLLPVIVHLYIATRTLLHPPQKAPLEVFILIVFLWSGRIMDLSYAMYGGLISGVKEDRMVMLTKVVDLVALNVMLTSVLVMPLGIPPQVLVMPQEGDDEEGSPPPAPEDYTTLWGWISFSWVSPLIDQGTIQDLTEHDIPDLSPSLQSKPVYRRFADFNQSTLLRRIIAANSLDFFLDCSLTLVSSAVPYALLYFLKNILYHVEHLDTIPHAKLTICIYAILAFLTTLARAELDLQHLWFGRRFCTRARSELMALIYEKALKRKYFSVIVKKGATSGDSNDGTDEADCKMREKLEEEDTKNRQNAAANIGKIVELMSSDANKIADMIVDFRYSTPIKVLVASIMLYQLLGWSAFVGLGLVVLASPFSYFLYKQGVKISQARSVARDERISVLNEFIGAISFVKVSAWESLWIRRVHDARTRELDWLKKERINSISLEVLWTIAPVVGSIASLSAYIHSGNKLTISTSFTAVLTFKKLKMALSEIPGFIVELLQARVSMDRIEKFLEEEEVPDYVSSFKWSPSHIAPDSPRTFEKNMLGLEHCSFRWNEAKGLKEENSKSKKGSPRPELPITTSSANAEPNMPEREEETREQEGFELRDISVIFPTGKFTIVTGPSSSGKSALLMALLGEMTLQPSPPSDPMSKVYLPKDPTQIDPSTNLRNCISYCAQSPWLQHDSIKNNILFGSPMDEERYNAVLEACGLIPDLIRFEDGDETELGAQGVSLSDGQKTRVALARAVYAMTGFVILDDPLATVDIHTARHLYEKLLIGPLMANRTLILVTHHIDLVRPGAHYLVRLSNGRIDMQGTIKELEEQGILEIIAHDQGETGTNEYTPELSNDDAKATAENVDKWHSGIAAENANFGEVGAQRKARKLVKQEARLEGRVKQKIYYTYFCDLLGTTLFLFLVALTIATKSTSVVEKLWMGVWGEQSNQIAPKHVIVSYHRMFLGLDHTVLSLYNALSSWQLSRIFLAIDGLTENQRDVSTSRYQLPSPDQHPMFYIGIYAAIGFGAALLSALSDILLFFGAIRASKILFKKISDAVIGSPIYFFNTTPTGRILNRLSRDIEIVDSPLSSSLRSVGVHIASLVVSLVTIVWLLPYFTIPAIVIAYVYYRLSYGFISAGRSLRRMESTTYSPIFAAFRDTLEGLVTLRAFSSEARFLDNLHSKVDLTTKMWYAFWMTSRHLLLRLDSLGALLTLLVTFFALSAGLRPSLIAMVITLTMDYTPSLFWTCRMMGQVEMEFTSVERVVEYSHLPQEPSAIVESNRVPAYWPTSSANPLVEVEDLVVKYAPELSPVLHGVSFSLKPKERIGVLGRTGSGKSTLAMSLLRFVDPAAGRIIIDGVDITTIGLQDLRSRLTIIPQDPVLFSGTIRNNVDPFREHSDEEIERVLERVHLYAHSNLTSSAAPSPTPSVNERVGGKAPSTSSVRLDDARTSVIPLDTKVGAGGANFSQGQRQLISMARALLRQSNIIIMDEATSSVDLATDTLIQRTIREEFPNSLLLTVSHRIRNIIDYDRLVVLDQGNLVEFDTPFNLINKPCGLFRTMCLKSGSFDDLFQVAKEKAQGQMQKIL